MTELVEKPSQMIKLQNPVANHYETWIVGNVTFYEEHFLEPPPVVGQDVALGQHVVICGAGPSLRENAAEWCPRADQVWGCNSALPWLVKHGHNPTHGFCIDQQAVMIEEWRTAPDVEYLLASSVHPHLPEFLVSRNRRLRFFHNYVGIQKPPVEWPDENGMVRREAYEDWLYMLLYPGTVRAGSGLNAVTRAIDVAVYMGFEKITLLGADCALKVKKPMPKGVALGSKEHTRWLKKHVVLHADGGHALTSAATPTTIEGEIDGVFFLTKPDMMISAVFLVHMKRTYGDRLNIVGEGTLPVAIMDKDDAYLNRLPCLIDSKGQAIKFFTDPEAVL